MRTMAKKSETINPSPFEADVSEPSLDVPCMPKGALWGSVWLLPEARRVVLDLTGDAAPSSRLSYAIKEKKGVSMHTNV